MVATTHVNHPNLSLSHPQPFLLVVYLFDSRKVQRTHLPSTAILPHPVWHPWPSRSRFSGWQTLPDTAFESQTHGTWQQGSSRKRISTAIYLTSGRRCCMWRPRWGTGLQPWISMIKREEKNNKEFWLLLRPVVNSPSLHHGSCQALQGKILRNLEVSVQMLKHGNERIGRKKHVYIHLWEGLVCPSLRQHTWVHLS